MEVELENNNHDELSSNNDGSAPSLHTLLLRSKKRTLDLFLTNHFQPRQDDKTALQIKLTTKINDEYGPVKDLPPPAPARAAQQPKAKAETSVTAPTPTFSNRAANVNQKTDKTKVVGTHPFPSGPGVSISEDDGSAEAEEEVTESAVQQVLRSIPRKAEPQVASSLIQYQAAAGASERIEAPSKTRALAIRNPYASLKPEWHAPWKLMRVISGHLGWVRAIAVDPSNDWFATGAADRTIKIWDLASGQLRLTLTGHINTVRGISISDRHPYLFSVSEDKTVRCWDLESNKVIRHYHGHLSGVYTCALHPTLDILVTGGRDSSVRAWDMRTKNCIHVLTGHTSTVQSVGCQATDPQIVSGSSDSTVRYWDLAKGACSTILTHHKKAVRAVTLHPEEYSMASGSPDNIKQWKFPEGKFLKNFSGHNSVINTLAVNRENVLVSGADNGSMYFWDWKTGYNFQKLQTVAQSGSLEAEAGIFASTFDLTGSRLLVGEADKSIKIYKEDEDATEESHPIEDWKPQSSGRF